MSNAEMTFPEASCNLQEPERAELGMEARTLALRDFSMVLALVAIWSFFAWQTGMLFVTPQNLSNLFVELSLTAILALGQLLIIICGQIDLSVGSGVGLLGGIAAVLISLEGWNAGAAMALAAVVALVIWLLMGLLIVREKVPAFIITLAGMLIFRGLQWRIINSSTIPAGQDNLLAWLTTCYLPGWLGSVLCAAVIVVMGIAAWRSRSQRVAFGFSVEPASLTFSKVFVLAQLLIAFTLICNQFQGLPLSVVILAMTALIIGVVLGHTRFGRYLYAIGSNEEAAVISGIPVGKVIIAAFAIMGLITALNGFMQTAFNGANTTTSGEFLELDAIAACVIGGTSLKGGRGTVMGVIFGSLIMASLINGMNLMAVEPWKEYAARGTVLALAVLLDVKLSKGHEGA